MSISIITASFNSEEFIGDTLTSIDQQTCKPYEHFIIDGNSTDRTLTIINSQPASYRKIISETDNGIYDAMNKGIHFSSGEYIAFLNSDDYYFSDNVLELVHENLQNTKADILYGDLVYVLRQNKDRIIRIWKSGEFKSKKLSLGWHPPHPTFIVKKSLYERFGYFNLNYPSANDTELMLRFLSKYSLTVSYLNTTMVAMRTGGISNRSFSNILKQNMALKKAYRDNNIAVSPLWPLFKIYSRAKQYITAKTQLAKD